MKNILLYPGGFKPFHDGHLLLLENVLDHNNKMNINEVYIITSNTVRDNITWQDVFPIISRCLKYLRNKYPNIKFIFKHTGNVSPIRYCYNIINESDDETYAVLSSDKSQSDENRNNILYSQYEVGGKYNQDKWDFNKVFKIPLKYIKAYEYCDDIISASDLRKYIKCDLYDKFKQGYIYILGNKIISTLELYIIYKKLRNCDI